ncbi:hypothetical protein [Chitinophaga barathri]|uniref:Uncharacterized protein n=1 Tax=Chitinophaga barathri TaxID=1647451 RepID=A0A3N4MF14_9BACT|nr:hypothetical protein [Chitinophaga barathri]RPD38229.1 hypothetical protein EG028_25365 [Chitinophaga barathri]
MKIRSPLFAVLALCAASIITFIACRKENKSSADEPSVPQELTVKQARGHFYKNVRPILAQHELKNEHKRGKLYPIWDKAKAYSKGEFEMVEVPIYWERRQLTTMHRRSTKDTTKRMAPDMSDLAGFDRIVFFKDKKGNVGQKLVSYSPDAAYLARHRYDASQNTLGKMDDDFSGYLIERSLSGKITFLKKVKNGKVTGTMDYQKALAKRKQNPQARYEEECTLVEEIYIYENICLLIVVDSPEEGYWEYVDCGDWELVEVILVYECVDVWVPDDPCEENPQPGCPGYDYWPDGEPNPGPTEPSAIPYPVQVPAGAPITDLASYLSVFDTGDPATLTVAVNQPSPGFRTVHNNYYFGDVYLTIEQTVGGLVRRRTLSLFPSAQVSYINISAISRFAQRKDMMYSADYDVKIETGISGLQLHNLILLFQGWNGSPYNLNTYNNATFGGVALRTVGINVPPTESTWIYGGRGNTPADLGEDIKAFSGVTVGYGTTPANLN